MSSNISTEIKSLNDVVRDKVKETFVNLIPEERWNELVQKSTEQFLEKDLPEIIKAELKDKLKHQIAAEIATAIQEGRTDTYGRPRASQLVEMIIKTLIPEIINSLIGSIVQDAVVRTQQNMRY